jgi:large subunit ribosomal protein L21
VYAIVKVAGMQYMVREGETLTVPKLAAEPGTSVRFDDVLFVRTESDLKLGRPHVADASVEADVVSHVRAGKVTTFKFIRRENYNRRKGHRQDLTKIKVTKINC